MIVEAVGLVASLMEVLFCLVVLSRVVPMDSVHPPRLGVRWRR